MNWSRVVAGLGGLEPTTAVRGATTRVPRLSRVRPGRAQIPLDPAGTVVIAGAGRIGGGLARHLVAAHGARRLLLISRGGAPALAADLTAMGAEVTTAACDATDRDALAAALATAPSPVTAVVHAVGVADYGVLESIDDESLRAVVSAKAGSAVVLHELTASMDLAAFVVSTSLAGVFGAVGHAVQGAANAALDALVEHRRALGLPATAIAWGPWGDGAAELDHDTSMALFDAAAAVPLGSLVAAKLDLPAVRSHPGPVPHLLRRLVRKHAATTAPAAPDWSTMPAEERDAALIDLVLGQAAAVLGHTDPSALDPDRGLLEQGYTSLTTVELRNVLAERTGLALSVPAVFDHPTPVELAAYLAELFAAAHRPAPPEDSLIALYRHAAAIGDPDAGSDMLMAASRLRPVFTLTTVDEHLPEPVRLAEGADSALLVCFPTVVATGGPQQYARFAVGFRGDHDVLVSPHPGYVDGEPLPDRFETVVEAHTLAVMRAAGERPVVLVGHSAGGLVAHAVATALQERGRPPTGLALIDSSWPGEMAAGLGAALLDGVLDRERDLGGDLLTTTRLTAMGGYNRMMGDWVPGTHDVPTLLVRASDPLQGADGEVRLQAVWKLPATELDVPGDHFTMMEGHAGATAATVRAWMRTLPITAAGDDRRPA